MNEGCDNNARKPVEPSDLSCAVTLRLRKAPAGLAVLPLAETERGRRRDSIAKNVAASDRVTEPEPRSLGLRELAPIFRLVRVDNVAEFGWGAHLGGVTFDHDVKTVEPVAPRRHNTVRVLGEVLRL